MPPITPQDSLGAIWRLGELPEEALEQAELTGADPLFPSSFCVGAAAQSVIAAAALAACELGHGRGAPRQRVRVDMLHGCVECSGWFSLDGAVPDAWDTFSGLYRCLDGHVRVHANFPHHRHGALALLGLDPARATRADAERAMLSWKGLDYEQASAERGLTAAALRRFAQWDDTPQGQAVARQPLLTIERIGDAPALPLHSINDTALPLAGVRYLDLTRILAGPVGGRACAALGADVMLVNGPHLPNIAAIADTSRGKRSALVDLRTALGKDVLWHLIEHAHVFSQGYRPDGLAELGFSPAAIAARRPGIVCVSLTAYGAQGPWAARRGFDSLVQSAMGFNYAEGEAEGEAAGNGAPRPLPMQILDQATGFLMAFGAAAALWRQRREGGSWLVRVSLAQTGHWLRGLGRVERGLHRVMPDFTPYLDTTATGFGELVAVRPSAQLARTPAGYRFTAKPPGSVPAVWW